jgi:hypothetical protein
MSFKNPDKLKKKKPKPAPNPKPGTGKTAVKKPKK